MVKDCIKFVLGFFRVRKVIRQVQPDLVYLNEYSVVQAALAARSCGVPAAMHIRSRMVQGMFGLRRRIMSRMVLRFTDAVFTITGIEAEQLKPHADEAKKIAVVGEFVPMDGAPKDASVALRERFGLPGDQKVVVMMGGIQEIKGTRDFLEAGALALGRYPGMVLVIAGGTRLGGDPRKRAYYESCMEVARTLEEGGHVRLLGEITNPLDLAATADILVASIRDTHFSRPVVEAWSFGKPVVAYRVPHMEHLIAHEADGLLVRAGDVQGLADAMVRLLEDPGLCHRLGEAGRQKVAASFDAKRNLEFIITRCTALCGAQ